MAERSHGSIAARLDSHSLSGRDLLYERRSHRLLSKADFIRRVAWHMLLVLVGILAALAIGVAGYHAFAGLSWTDSVLNASMLLGGMGPVSPLNTPGAKLFASAYALFSGLVFIALAGLMVAPFFHRLLHHFHLDEDDARRD